MGPKKGLEKPNETIEKVIAGGADAILTSYGIARKFSGELRLVRTYRARRWRRDQFEQKPGDRVR